MELLDRLHSLGVGLAGQRLLDIGTGTGTLAREFARASCLVTGLDSSPWMLDEALRLDELSGADVKYVRSRAEDSGLEDKSFDAITAGQCWDLFDRRAVALECYRLLKPGGKLAVVHSEWVRLPGGVAESTEELLSQHEPMRASRVGKAMHRRLGRHLDWLDELAEVGFQRTETFSFDVQVPVTHEQWLGFVRERAELPAGPKAARFERELSAMLLDVFQDDALPVVDRVFAAVTSKEPGLFSPSSRTR